MNIKTTARPVSDIHDGEDEPAYLGYQKIRRKEKAKHVLKFFSAVAEKYDFMNSVLSLGIHHHWKRTAIRQLRLNPGDSVLDICGGTGDLAILSAKSAGLNGHVFLCDMNRQMMTAGLNRNTDTKIRKQILYIQGDAENLPLQNDSFHAVTVGFGIRNLTSIACGFDEMFRVLKPGGKLMCLEFSQPVGSFFRYLYDFYSFCIIPHLGSWLADSPEAYTYLSESIRMFPMPEVLKTMMEHAGFSDVRYQRLTRGIAVIHTGIKR